MSGIDTRLAAYGTLQPGRSNHHQMDGMAGDWRPGVVRGHFHANGWGAALGYPGLILDPDGPEVAVVVFTSPDLPAQLGRLDAFEGDGYRRVAVTVATSEGPVEAWLYELAEAPPAP